MPRSIKKKKLISTKRSPKRGSISLKKKSTKRVYKYNMNSDKIKVGEYITVTQCGSNKIQRQFSISELIGKGSFGSVYKIYDEYGSSYALKILKVDTQDGITDLNELDMLCSIKHPNILHANYFYMSNLDIGYVLPIATSDLYEYVKSNRPVSLEIMMKWAYQFLSAMEFLHKNGYSHCDMKPENCLIIDGNLVIADFGFTFNSYSNLDRSCTATPDYSSPQRIYDIMRYHYGNITDDEYIEKFKNLLYNKSSINIFRQQTNVFADDVWAIGLVLYYIFSWGKRISNTNTFEELVRDLESFIQKDLNSFFRNSIVYNKKEIVSILELCFAINPIDRWTSLKLILNSNENFINRPRITGKIIEGTIIEPLDCVNFKPSKTVLLTILKVFDDIHGSNMTNINTFKPIRIYQIFNAIDLFYRSYQVLKDQLTNRLWAAIAYYTISTKITYVNYSTSIKKICALFQIDNYDVKYVVEYERKIVCTLGGILGRKLIYEYNYKIDPLTILKFLLTNDGCSFVSNLKKYL
jgi:serine/threonine protein kinase